MTVYRQFDDLTGIVSALLTAELVALLDVGLGGHGARCRPPASGSWRRARSWSSGSSHHPLYRRVLDVDPELLLPLVVDRFGSTQRAAIEVVAGLVAQGVPEGSVRPVDPHLAATCLLLTAQSFVFSARVVEAETSAGADRRRAPPAARRLPRAVSRPDPRARRGPRPRRPGGRAGRRARRRRRRHRLRRRARRRHARAVGRARGEGRPRPRHQPLVEQARARRAALPRHGRRRASPSSPRASATCCCAAPRRTWCARCRWWCRSAPARRRRDGAAGRRRAPGRRRAAPGRRHPARPRCPRPRRISAVEAVRLLPAVRRDGLRGGLLGWDGQLEDDARLVVALARTAAAHGARVLTRVARAVGATARLRDELTGERLQVRARRVVNATGAWAGRSRPRSRCARARARTWCCRPPCSATRRRADRAGARQPPAASSPCRTPTASSTSGSPTTRWPARCPRCRAPRSRRSPSCSTCCRRARGRR